MSDFLNHRTDSLRTMQVLVAKYLADEGEDKRIGLLAWMKTRTSLRLIVHVGAVFICPGYMHGPSGRTCWKVIECG